MGGEGAKEVVEVVRSLYYCHVHFLRAAACFFGQSCTNAPADESFRLPEASAKNLNIYL